MQPSGIIKPVESNIRMHQIGHLPRAYFFVRTCGIPVIQLENYDMNTENILCRPYEAFGDRSSTVVKVLCYKSEGRWFDPS